MCSTLPCLSIEAILRRWMPIVRCKPTRSTAYGIGITSILHLPSIYFGATALRYRQHGRRSTLDERSTLSLPPTKMSTLPSWKDFMTMTYLRGGTRHTLLIFIMQVRTLHLNVKYQYLICFRKNTTRFPHFSHGLQKWVFRVFSLKFLALSCSGMHLFACKN